MHFDFQISNFKIQNVQKGMVYSLKGNKAEARLYGDIGNWMSNGNAFAAMLDELRAKGVEELTLRLHCYGGSVMEGNVIHNLLGSAKMKVRVVIDGIAASMGCFILTAVSDVAIADNGFGMVHRPTSCICGDAGDLTAAVKLLRDMETNFAKKISERSRLPEAEVRAKWFDGKDHWLNAQEMVQYGFAKSVTAAVAKSMDELDKAVVEQSKVEDIYSRFAAKLNQNSKPKNQKNMDTQVLIAALGLTGVTSESADAAVIAAIQAHEKTLSDRIAALEADEKAKRAAAITALLDKAQASGKFAAAGKKPEDVRATYQKIGEASGVEALEVVLGTAAGQALPQASILSQLQGVPAQGQYAAGGEKKTWDWYQKNDVTALVRMEKEDNAQFRELYKGEYQCYPQ